MLVTECFDEHESEVEQLLWPAQSPDLDIRASFGCFEGPNQETFSSTSITSCTWHYSWRGVALNLYGHWDGLKCLSFPRWMVICWLQKKGLYHRLLTHYCCLKPWCFSFIVQPHNLKIYLFVIIFILRITSGWALLMQ